MEPIETALAAALPDVLSASVDTLNIKNVIGQLGDVMYKFPFNLPPYYTAIVRCLGVLEGLAIQVDPKFRIINDAYPYVASRVLSDAKLQDILQYMVLTKDDKVRWSRLENLLQSASTAGAGGISSWDMERTAQLFGSFCLAMFLCAPARLHVLPLRWRRGSRSFVVQRLCLDGLASFAVALRVLRARAGDFVLAPANRRVRDTVIDDVTDWLDTLGLDSLRYLSTLAAPPASQSTGSVPDQLARRALAPLQLASSALRGEDILWDSQQDPPPATVRALVEQVARISNSRSPNGRALAQRGLPLVQELALTTLDRPEVGPRLSLACCSPCAASPRVVYALG